MWNYDEKQKELILSLLSKGKKEQVKNEKFAIIKMRDFLSLFVEEEKNIINDYLTVDPKRFGYKLPYIGTSDNTNDLVAIKNQSYTDANGEKIIIPCQYLPRKTYETYTRLNKAMYQQIGKKYWFHMAIVLSVGKLSSSLIF